MNSKQIAIVGLILGGIGLLLAVLKLRATQTAPANVGVTTIEPLINVGPAGPEDCPTGTVWAPLNRLCLPIKSPLPPLVAQTGIIRDDRGEIIFDPSTALVN